MNTYCNILIFFGGDTLLLIDVWLTWCNRLLDVYTSSIKGPELSRFHQKAICSRLTLTPQVLSCFAGLVE
jgi:hypothetical protein